jgi:hypothetical protein
MRKNPIAKVHGGAPAIVDDPQLKARNAAAPLADDLVIGAGPLARYLFGDADKARKVYPLRKELGLFNVGGQIAGLKSKLRERIEAKAAGVFDVDAA